MRVWMSLIAVAACSPPPAPSAVRAKVDTDLGGLLASARAAQDGITAALDAHSTLAVVGGLCGLSAPSWDPAAVTGWLDQQVFADANTKGDGRYELPAALFCGDTPDPACTERVALAQPAVRVEQDDPGTMRFAIELDADHDEPLVFQLQPGELDATLDLDGEDAAIGAFAQLLGAEPVSAGATGYASAIVSSVDASSIVAMVGVDNTIEVQGSVSATISDGELISLGADGSAPAGTLALAFGELALHLPGVPSTDLDLPSATGSVSLSPSGLLELDQLWLGDRTTTLSRGGVPALTIDLDPDDGRSVSAMVGATATVTPRLDLRRTVDDAALGETPAFDVTEVVVDGTLASTPVADQVAVQQGSFTATTEPASFGFAASAGQCVSASDGGYVVGACP
ncbi:MAG TPA: hypothetical protein VLX92_05710 [Kofleriaceae bacterium]|nr:hypothetical protein [Kofleriaceae bacterium]